MTAIRALPIDAIVAGNNDRRRFDQAGLEELAASIERDGLAQPITVRPLADGTYECVCSERRLRAHRLLGRTTVDAVVRDLDDRRTASVMLAENVARKDLDPIDEGWAYQRRMDEFGLSMVQVAEWAGVSWNRVEAKVRLLRLLPEVQDLIRLGALGETAAWAMDGLDANRQRLAIAGLNAGLQPPAFKALCQRLRTEQDEEPLFDADTFLQIEEYVARAQVEAKVTKPEQMRRLLLAMADALPAGHPLADEARVQVAATRCKPVTA